MYELIEGISLTIGVFYVFISMISLFSGCGIDNDNTWIYSCVIGVIIICISVLSIYGVI